MKRRCGAPVTRPERSSSARASAASSSATSASVATSRSDTSCSPSTASARATGPPALGRRSSRRSTDARTVSGPSEATRSALSAVGSMLSARTSLTSCSSRNGFPPVACWHAAAKAGSGGPSNASIRRAAPSAESGAGPDRDGRGVSQELRQRDRERRHLGRPHPEQEDHRQIGDPEAEEVLGGHRRLVRPLGVVDRDQERAVAGQVGDHPVQPVKALIHELGAVALLRRPWLEDRQRQLGGAREQGGALLVGLVERDRIGRLAHDSVRIAALQLGRAHRDRVHAALLGEVEAGPHEARLADAGRALDRDHAAAPLGGAGQSAVEGVDLRLAFEQVWISGRGLRVHARNTGWRRGRPRCETGASAPPSSQ